MQIECSHIGGYTMNTILDICTAIVFGTVLAGFLSLII